MPIDAPAPSPSPPLQEAHSLGEGEFTGRKVKAKDGSWLAEAQLPGGNLVWVVMDEEPK